MGDLVYLCAIDGLLVHGRELIYILYPINQLLIAHCCTLTIHVLFMCNWYRQERQSQSTPFIQALQIWY